MAFIALNYRAYDGFFQDDELDNLSWAPLRTASEFAIDLVKPTFDTSNFRPPGHLYFALMGRAFGMDFPPYMTPIFAIHLVNGILLFFLMRKLRIPPWQALAGTAFFTVSATAMDAYWKPMYVFDLLCTTFSLASILLFAWRRWILSFIAFWLAYKSKELAVMLPFALLAYEYWLGERRYILLAPFFLTSLSFGLQGLLFNPNKDNDYTFRFTLDALRKTVPYYAHRLLYFRASGLLPLLLLFIRDRRIWFALASAAFLIFTLLFLPGRLFEAYAYLPLAFITLAIAAAASHARPVWVWIALAIWLPFNTRQLRDEQRIKLARDDAAFAFVEQIQTWAAHHPGVKTLVYDSAPEGFHDWGVTAAWNIAHNTLGLSALFHDWPQTAQAIDRDTVVFATLDPNTKRQRFQVHAPQ